MLQTQLIKEFLDNEVIAVVGVSRKKDIPANGIFKKFKSAGYRVYPINPNADQIDGEKCYPDIQSTTEKPDAVLIAGPPEISKSIVSQCLQENIRHIWMHRGIGNGSYSEEAEKLCLDNGVEPITNGCPMMFVKPVDPFHFVFRLFK